MKQTSVICQYFIIKNPGFTYYEEIMISILSTWLRWLFASKAFYNPVEEYYFQFPSVIETTITNRTNTTSSYG